MLIHQNHAAGEENGSIMVGMFVCLCLASKKPSEREFFVPAGTDLGVKLLTRVPNESQHQGLSIGVIKMGGFRCKMILCLFSK
jgi:hypothetical protein